MSRIVESLYRTQLNEMALDEMSLQKPARFVKTHLSYSNKYSFKDIKKLCDSAFDAVYEHDESSKKYVRTIKSISDILLSDFETDFYEYVNNMEEDDEYEYQALGKNIISHYYKYSEIFKNYYVKCKQDFNDENKKVLKNSFRSASMNLTKGIKDYILNEYQFMDDRYDLL